MPPPCSCATSVWSYLIGTSDHTVRSEIFARWQFQRIEQAVATVGALARPPENNLAPETLLSRYSHGPPVPAVIAGHDHSTRHDWRQGHTGGLGIPASHRAHRVATDAMAFLNQLWPSSTSIMVAAASTGFVSEAMRKSVSLRATSPAAAVPLLQLCRHESISSVRKG